MRTSPAIPLTLLALALPIAACDGGDPAPAAPEDVQSRTDEQRTDWIVFGSDRAGSAGLDLYRIRSDGTGLQRLTNDLADEYHPSFSPDGSRIVFVRGSYPESNLSVMNADGSGLRRLTQDPGGETEPDWSPDGERIAFTRYGEVGPREIYVINVDGTGLTRVTSGFQSAFEPDWAPDGAHIAFTGSTATGETGVYVVRLSDGETWPVAPGAADELNHEPAWSPDGQWIAFTHLGDDRLRHTHIARPDGTERRAVHTAPWNAMTPVWSPDGDRIAVLRWGRELANWIVLLDLDGNGMRAVVGGAGPLVGGGADWSGTASP